MARSRNYISDMARDMFFLSKTNEVNKIKVLNESNIKIKTDAARAAGSPPASIKPLTATASHKFLRGVNPVASSAASTVASAKPLQATEKRLTS